jgi:hypothetical protein
MSVKDLSRIERCNRFCTLFGPSSAFSGRFNLYTAVFHARGYRRERICFSANSSAYIPSEKQELGALPTPFASHWLDCRVFSSGRDALTIVKPDTLICWHRKARPRSGFSLPSRRSVRLHFNVTRHPTADWTLQQFRECVTGDEGYRFVIHDRDSIYSKDLQLGWNARSTARSRFPQRWMTFVRNHARAMIACDFVVCGGGDIQLVYVFLIMEI